MRANAVWNNVSISLCIPIKVKFKLNRCLSSSEKRFLNCFGKYFDCCEMENKRIAALMVTPRSERGHPTYYTYSVSERGSSEVYNLSKELLKNKIMTRRSFHPNLFVLCTYFFLRVERAPRIRQTTNPSRRTFSQLGALSCTKFERWT